MSKKKWIISGGVIVALVAATIVGRQLTGKNSASADSSSESSEKVTTLQVAHNQNYVPYDYINEKGDSDGFEVAVLKAIDEKLKNYKFDYTGTSDEDLLIGLESGKYDIGVKGAWYTEERAQKFIIPDEAIGASVIGFAIRKEDESKYKDIDSFAKNGGKLVPISPQNAQYNVIQEYNKKAKNQIERIIFPQAIKQALPNLCNLVINLVKGTSLIFVMTVKDITAIAKVEAAYGYHYFESYFVIFVIYIVICGLIQYAFKVLERRAQIG